MINRPLRGVDPANNVAEIFMRRAGVVRHSPVGQQKPMVEEVLPGDWEIEIDFPDTEFQRVSSVYTLLPPIFEGVPAP